MEWLHADDNVTTIHHYTDSEIAHMVISLEKNGSEEESSDENEEDVRERITTDSLNKNCSHFLLQYIQHICISYIPDYKTRFFAKFKASKSKGHLIYRE